MEGHLFVPWFRLGHHTTALHFQIQLLELLVKLQEIPSDRIQLPVRLLHHALLPSAPHIGHPSIPHLQLLITSCLSDVAISVCHHPLIIGAVLIDLCIVSLISNQPSWGEVASS